MDRTSRIVFWCMLLLSALMGFFALDRSPTVWFDEAAYVEPAWRLAMTGSLRSYSLFDGGELGMPFLAQVPLYFFFQATIIKILGFSVWTMRGSGVLFHLLSAAMLFRILRRRFGPLPAFAGMSFALYHPMIIAAARSGRMDAMAMALGCGSLLAIDEMAHRQRRVWGALGGLLMGLAILTHPAVAGLVPAGIWLARSPGEPSYRQWMLDLGLVAATGAIPLIPWVVYITQVAPAAYRAQLGNAVAALEGAGVPLWPQWVTRLRELVQGFRFFVLGALASVAALAGCGLARRSRPCMFVGLAALAFHVFVMRGTIFGQVHVVLALVFPLAAGARELRDRIPATPKWGRAFAALAALFLANGLLVPGARVFAAAWQYQSRSPVELARQWAQKIPASATVTGPPYAFYVALQHNGNYRPVHRLFPELDMKSPWYPGALCRAHPEYFVVPAGVTPSKYLGPDCPVPYALHDRIRLPSAPIRGLAVDSYDSDIYAHPRQ